MNGQHPRDGARDWDLFGDLSRVDKAKGHMSNHFHGRLPRAELKKQNLSSESRG